MKILNLEKIVPDAEARKELFEQHMMETTLRLNAPRIIRALDNACDSKRTADRIWKIIWMDVRSGKAKDFSGFSAGLPRWRIRCLRGLRPCDVRPARRNQGQDGGALE